MEKETSNYYHVSSRWANEWDVKETFRELAGLKQVHMKYVQSLYGMIQQNGDIIYFEDFKKKKDIPPDDSWVPVKEIEKHYSFTDDTGILIKALEIEAKPHELYRNLSKAAPNNVAKGIL